MSSLTSVFLFLIGGLLIIHSRTQRKRKKSSYKNGLTHVFHLPPEPLSTQKAESLDQTSKEVPRGKMGGLMEAIDLGIRN
jgi:hypothetical protein